MTVSSTDLRIVQYAGSGSAGPFSLTFGILDDDDMLVISSNDTTGIETTLVKTTDYTVSSTLNSITLVSVLASGNTLTIKGSTPLTQETDFTDYSVFPAEATEDALDKLTYSINELKETIGRGISAPISIVGFDGEIASVSASRFLRINEDGDGVEAVDTTDDPLAIDIILDLSPQLGANLDTNGFNILLDTGKYIGDENNNEQIVFTTTASAVNYIGITNTATGNGPIISSAGSDSNVNLNFQAKGTGVFNFKGTSDQQAEIRLFEDTDNGTNYIAVKPGSSISSNTTLTLPNTTGTVALTSDIPASTAYGMQWISTTTASAASVVDVDLPTGYTHYYIKIVGVTSGSDDKDLYARFRTTGGAIRSGATDYWTALQTRVTAGFNSGSTNAAQIHLNDQANTAIGNAAGEHVGGEIWIGNARNASLFTMLRAHIGFTDTASKPCDVNLTGSVSTAESNDRIEFLMESGSTLTGTFILYGFRES